MWNVHKIPSVWLGSFLFLSRIFFLSLQMYMLWANPLKVILWWRPSNAGGLKRTYFTFTLEFLIVWGKTSRFHPILLKQGSVTFFCIASYLTEFLEVVSSCSSHWCEQGKATLETGYESSPERAFLAIPVHPARSQMWDVVCLLHVSLPQGSHLFYSPVWWDTQTSESLGRPDDGGMIWALLLLGGGCVWLLGINLLGVSGRDKCISKTLAVESERMSEALPVCLSPVLLMWQGATD